MVPSSFIAFFAATSGAGAALIGLLFVSISISPERIFSRSGAPELTAVASSAFTALVNAFFISTMALLPNLNVGFVTYFLGAFGLINSLLVGVQLVRRSGFWRRTDGVWRRMLSLARSVISTALSLFLYGYQIALARQALAAPHDAGSVENIAILVLAVYGFGLSRAWELLGARSKGVLSWLSPLRELDEREARASPTTTSTPTPQAAPVAAPTSQPAP